MLPGAAHGAALLTDAERAWVAAHPVVRVGLESRFAPFSFVAGEDQPRGISADYLALLERELGVRFEVAATGDLATLLDAARRGEVDLLTSLMETPERASFLRFTAPYFTVPAVVVVRNDHAGPGSLEQMTGRRVAVGRGYAVEAHLRQAFPGLDLVPFANDATALRALVAGSVDAAVLDLASASWLITETGLHGLRILDDSGFSYALSMAVRRDLPELQAVLDAGLRGVTREEAARIRGSWIRLDEEPHGAGGLVALAVLAMAAVGLIVLAGGRVVNRALSAQVARRTEQLAESELKYRSIFEGSRDGIVIADPATRRLVSANPSFCRMLGHPPEEIPRLSVQDVHRAEDLPRVLEAFEALRAGRIAYATDVPVLRKDGSVFLAEVSAEPILIGGREHLVGVFRDSTERVVAAEELRKGEARFRALIERSSDLTLVVEPSGVIGFANPASQEVLGVPPGALVGASILERLHPEDRARARAALEAVLTAPGTSQRLELRLRREGGGHALVESTVRNLLDVAGVGGIVVNNRDITERNRYREQFQQAQKLESVGRLAGGVAHDFNNLLTVILACGEDLRHALRDAPPEQRELVDDVLAAGGRAAELTRQLLAFARKQVIAPEVLDLNAVLRDTRKLLGRVIGEDVRLVENLEAGLWNVRCDPGLVNQIVMNLAVNARDAMPQGGFVTLSTSNVEVTPGDAAPVPDMAPGAYVRLSVADSGVGMPPDVLAHVFEPFFTTKSPGVGTGLGLATVYGIVKQSEGHIAVRSRPGEGTTFDVYFPRADSPGGEARAQTASRPDGFETVLVVEDDPKVREVTVRALRGGGYRVLAAAGADEAFDIAMREATPVHLLLTDVVMPGTGGREVARRVAELRPGIRVLFTSGYTRDAISRQGVIDEGVEFLPKPFTAAALLRRVRELLDAA